MKTRNTSQVLVGLSLWSPVPVVWGTRRKSVLWPKTQRKVSLGRVGHVSLQCR